MHGRPVSCAGEHGRSVRRNAADQRPERHRRSGDHERLLIYGSQFRFHGLRGGLKKFSEPVSVVTPLNIMEIGIRPLSLCMRLFGNIFAGFVIMELVKMAIPVVVPIPLSLYFDVFDGMIQAIVFVFLTTLFLSESLE